MSQQPKFPERIVAIGAQDAISAAVVRHELGRCVHYMGDDTTLALVNLPEGATVHRLGKSPKALLSHAEMLVQALDGASGLIAIGSGTVNDVAKLAAHRRHLPYLVCATAASMNGYASATASLIDQGHKQSYAATAPKAVLADLAILSSAPRRMARAGLGDTLCRSTIVADSLLSHRIFNTPFPREWFVRLQQHETWLMQNATLLREGASDYMKKLMHALLDAGDAMHATGSSAVASQGEHMIAHTLELMYGAELHDILHGELIAVTTSSMALLQHKMLLSEPQLRSLSREDTQFVRQFGRVQGSRLHAEYAQKVIAAEQLDALDFPMLWAGFKEELAPLIAPVQTIERSFVEAGLATRPEGIGLLADRYNAARSYAYLTRARFGFLDLAAMNARRT